MKHFGIIGYPLEHSRSAAYFNQLFEKEKLDAEYKAYSIENIDLFTELLQKVKLSGLNVTSPYKEAVIPYLNELSDAARSIGAVNVIEFSGADKLIGHNTDAIGFEQSIRPLITDVDKHALLLGTGGAAKAVKYGLSQLGITSTLVSRQLGKGLLYEHLNQSVVAEHTIIINCTPLGMYPDTASCVQFPFEFLTDSHLVYDVIYNPDRTTFLKRASRYTERLSNGYQMWYYQALATQEIFLRSIKRAT